MWPRCRTFSWKRWPYPTKSLSQRPWMWRKGSSQNKTWKTNLAGNRTLAYSFYFNMKHRLLAPQATAIDYAFPGIASRKPWQSAQSLDSQGWVYCSFHFAIIAMTRKNTYDDVEEYWVEYRTKGNEAFNETNTQKESHQTKSIEKDTFQQAAIIIKYRAYFFLIFKLQLTSFTSSPGQEPNDGRTWHAWTWWSIRKLHWACRWTKSWGRQGGIYDIKGNCCIALAKTATASGPLAFSWQEKDLSTFMTSVLTKTSKLHQLVGELQSKFDDLRTTKCFVWTIFVLNSVNLVSVNDIKLQRMMPVISIQLSFWFQWIP